MWVCHRKAEVGWIYDGGVKVEMGDSVLVTYLLVRGGDSGHSIKLRLDIHVLDGGCEN